MRVVLVCALASFLVLLVSCKRSIPSQQLSICGLQTGIPMALALKSVKSTKASSPDCIAEKCYEIETAKGKVHLALYESNNRISQIVGRGRASLEISPGVSFESGDSFQRAKRLAGSRALELGDTAFIVDQKAFIFGDINDRVLEIDLRERVFSESELIEFSDADRVDMIKGKVKSLVE